MMLRSSCRAYFLAVLVAVGFAATAQATNYIEGPDLSNTFNAPTGMGATLGTNSLGGLIGSGDLDYVTFTVPAGHLLSQVVNSVYQSTNGTAFLGMQSGSAFTVSAGAAGAGDLLGYVHFGFNPPNTIGTNVLDDIATAPGAQGFAPPLPAGAYTFWLQQATGEPTQYQFDLMVTAVPEPSCLTLLGVVACGIAASFRRRA